MKRLWKKKYKREAEIKVRKKGGRSQKGESGKQDIYKKEEKEVEVEAGRSLFMNQVFRADAGVHMEIYEKIRFQGFVGGKLDLAVDFLF